MTPLLPVLLAAAAAALLVAPPRLGVLRLEPSRHSALPPRTGGLVPLVCLGGALLLLGPIAAVLAGAAAWGLRQVVRARRTSTSVRAERARALEALALLASDLRAGRVPADALAAASGVAVGGAGRALAAAAAAARLGGDVPAALVSTPSAVPDVLRGLGACWAVCFAAGSGLAAGVEQLSAGMRAANAQRRAIDAELAGPRATAALLAVLPLGGMGLAAALGADPVRLLLHTPVGLACLLAGLALDAAGLLWTWRLVARAGGG